MTQDFEESWIAFMTQDKQLFGWLYAQLVAALWIALCTASSRFIYIALCTICNGFFGQYL